MEVVLNKEKLMFYFLMNRLLIDESLEVAEIEVDHYLNYATRVCKNLDISLRYEEKGAGDLYKDSKGLSYYVLYDEARKRMRINYGVNYKTLSNTIDFVKQHNDKNETKEETIIEELSIMCKEIRTKKKKEFLNVLQEDYFQRDFYHYMYASYVEDYEYCKNRKLEIKAEPLERKIQLSREYDWN